MRKALVTLCLFGLGQGAVLAQSSGKSLIDRNFIVQLGGFAVSTDTNVRLDASSDRFGTEINLEDDLGFEDASRFRLDGLWRISPRHHLRAEWFRLDRDVERTIERNLEFGDIVIPIRGSVSADLKTQIGQLAYEYAFARGKNYEIAASLGVHVIWFDLALAASGGGNNFQSRTERAETTAPLPVVGLRGLWRLGGDFYVDASAQYFEAGIDQYDGSIEDYRAAVIWMPWRNFGFGAGYNHFEVDVEVTDPNFTGALGWQYGGVVVFANVAF